MSTQAASSAKTPKGVVGIFTDPQGRVIASISDFDRGRYGGFSLEETQSLRVRKKLAAEVVCAFSSPVLLKALDDYDVEKIVRNLVRDHGYTQTLIPIGYGTEEIAD